ncbi:pyrroline-5-carboxylate reductase [Brucepastera parasyntrophica]|uniref:pyrroline-5-carboxylate reductase n=1 Tax=Brucepastera parasyntrophica TaxID=2880008 RepID=UPI00210AE1D5|nr:pyrroline-5-carboxylate reductase [Brucepastera parasyntrophica]ULQ59197.1 pyrroline-5-carboxylate reductase [Brucepastera parasyntrophica]
MKKKKAGCIGMGVMGSALMESIIRVAGAEEMIVFDSDKDKARDFAERTGCTLAGSGAEVASSADYVFLAVKPQFLNPVLAEISGHLDTETVLVSMAAGIKIDHIKKRVDRHPKVIRIMPNMPAAVNMAMIAIAPDAAVPDETIEELERLLSAAGLTERTAESLMDAFTAVSGSGPAYGFIFIEALADAGVRMGIPRAQAIRYAAQTLKGAAEMVIRTDEHPGELKDRVCSPGGTTIAAVTKLEEKNFRSAVIESALAAWERSKELGKSE